MLSILPEQPEVVTRIFMRIKWEKEHFRSKELSIGNAVLKVPPHWYIDYRAENKQGGVVNCLGLEKSYILFIATGSFYHSENTGVECELANSNYSVCSIDVIEDSLEVNPNIIYYLPENDIFMEITQVKGQGKSDQEYQVLLQLLIKNLRKQ